MPNSGSGFSQLGHFPERFPEGIGVKTPCFGQPRHERRRQKSWGIWGISAAGDNPLLRLRGDRLQAALPAHNHAATGLFLGGEKQKSRLGSSPFGERAATTGRRWEKGGGRPCPTKMHTKKIPFGDGANPARPHTCPTQIPVPKSPQIDHAPGAPPSTRSTHSSPEQGFWGQLSRFQLRPQRGAGDEADRPWHGSVWTLRPSQRALNPKPNPKSSRCPTAPAPRLLPFQPPPARSPAADLALTRAF